MGKTRLVQSLGAESDAAGFTLTGSGATRAAHTAGDYGIRTVGVGNWNTRAQRSAYALADGEYMEVRFQMTTVSPTLLLGIETDATWGDQDYYRLSLNLTSGSASIKEVHASSTIHNTALPGTLEDDTWYRLRVVVDDTAGILLEIYPETGGERVIYRAAGMPAGESWRFSHENHTGTIHLDDYAEGPVTTFRYDSGGQRTVTVQPDGTCTGNACVAHYAFAFYEVEEPGETNEVARSSYFLAGMLVAVRVDGTTNALYYMHTDHLGSASLMSSGGNAVSGTTARYLPFGGTRLEATADLTEYGYTGHHANNYIKLVYMNARWYVPGIGRFASADTIVPDPGNPQSYNRYVYVLGNPLRYVDPSGHCGVDPYDEYYDYECWALANQLHETYQEADLSLDALTEFSHADLLIIDRILRQALAKAESFRDFSLRHAWVQAHFIIQNPGVLPEQSIRNSGPNGGTGYADLINLGTGEIWEVKPISTPHQVALEQLGRYVENHPGGAPGTPVRSIVRTIDPVAPMQNLSYSSAKGGIIHEGLIFYWTSSAPRQRFELSIDISPETAAVLTLGAAAVGAGRMIGGALSGAPAGGGAQIYFTPDFR